MKRNGNTGNREVRTFSTSEMRVVRADGESPKIVGHAAVFDSPTQIGPDDWGFMESVIRGAFAESIKVDDIRALFNHDPNLVLGRNMAGTLTLTEDKKGLYYEIDPPDTQAGRDLLESIARGDVTGSSFGFDVQEQRWTLKDDGLDERELVTLKLYDVSPVTFPAYDDTDVAKRQHQEFRDAQAAAAETPDPDPEAKKDSDDKSGDDNGFRPNSEQMSRRLRLED